MALYIAQSQCLLLSIPIKTSIGYLSNVWLAFIGVGLMLSRSRRNNILSSFIYVSSIGKEGNKTKILATDSPNNAWHLTRHTMSKQLCASRSIHKTAHQIFWKCGLCSACPIILLLLLLQSMAYGQFFLLDDFHNLFIGLYNLILVMHWCSSMVPGSRNPMWGEEFNFSADELPVQVAAL